MKKRTYCLFFIVVLFISVIQIVNVQAEDYKVNTLIPVNTVASVETDKFDYKNFTYNSTVDEKGNATIKFEAIQNNTLSKTAISINVLLFDENKKNIGFLTYCTDKDVSSDNAGFKIRANQVVPFTITVTQRYFVDGKLPKDVRYIAVRDENRYCQICGYSNYKGLTIEEIVNGVPEQESGFSFPDFSSYVNMSLILLLFAIIAIIGMILGLIKLLKYLKGRKNTKKPIIKKTVKEKKTTNNTNTDNVSETSSLVNSEANKPIDLNSLYQDENQGMSGIDIPDSNNNKEVSIEDLFTPSAPNPTPIPEQVNEETKAVPVENLYNSINELPEEKSSEEDNSVSDLYNSINGISDSDKDSKVSIDDLYESINSEDEDEDISDD